VEQFNADIMAIDYRGQTPLHVATSSSELGATLYISSCLDLIEKAREKKDNALMTPLMNTVNTNNLSSFVFLFFKEHCHLNHVDIYGNTLMHLAAKSNALNIAKILKHLYLDCQDKSSPFHELLASQSSQDHMTSFFDLNRTNL